MKITDYLLGYLPHIWATFVAGVFSVITISLSLFLIFEHLSSYKNPEEQKFLIGVVLMVPCYFVESSLGPESCFMPSIRSVGVKQSMDYIANELTESDRPGLLSEVSDVLRHLKCNVVNAEVWTHNTRAAVVMRVTDEETETAITDPERLSRIKFADRDYERTGGDVLDDRQRPNVDVVNWHDRDYSVVTIRCKDRPKLLFDTVCTLTDMDYVVFQENIDTLGLDSYQEYYIRHLNGSPVKSDAERQRVTQFLKQQSREEYISKQGTGCC